MSVNTSSTAGVGSTGPAAAPAEARPAFSFLNLGTFGGVTRDAPSVVLNKAKEAIFEALKSVQVDRAVEVNVLPIDNTKLNRLQLSGITMIMKPVDANQRVASFHTLVLEASGSALDDTQVTIDGATISVPQYTEKVYDKVYADTVADQVAQALPNYKTYSVAAEIVPREFNWDDKEAVRLLVVNAVCAVGQELQHRYGSGEINLANVQRDSNLKVQVAYNQSDLVSAVGMPVRADLQMNLSAEAIDRGDQSTVNNQRRSEQMAKLAGFIDAIWSPAAPQAGAFYGQPQSKQKYIARLTLTRAEAYSVMTPGMQLLVLASCLQLAENGSWWSYFRPRPTGQVGPVDKRDVGALNIEANVYNEEGAFATPLNTKGQSFDDQELGRFLMQAFSPDLAVAVDVGTCTDDTWYNEIFAWAAAGDPNASQALVNAANEVTNGQFKEFWKGGDVVVQNEDIVLNGYYTVDGVKHDIRDIDYIAIMNLVGRTNPLIGAAFTDTYLRTEQPLVKRLIARRNIISDLVPGVKWTGTSRRVTMMAPFMSAFLLGIQKCGLQFRMVNPGAQGEFHSSRGTGDYLRGAAFGSQASGAFSQGFGGSSAAAGTFGRSAPNRQW